MNEAKFQHPRSGYSLWEWGALDSSFLELTTGCSPFHYLSLACTPPLGRLMEVGPGNPRRPVQRLKCLGILPPSHSTSGMQPGHTGFVTLPRTVSTADQYCSSKLPELSVVPNKCQQSEKLSFRIGVRIGRNEIRKMLRRVPTSIVSAIQMCVSHSVVPNPLWPHRL